MSTFELVRQLKSFRSGSDDTIGRDVLGRVLEAGRNAPSPGGVHSLEFIVVESEEQREKLAECAGDSRIEDAGAAIVIVSDVERMRRRAGELCQQFCIAEASCAAQNMRLVASEENLHSCWITGIDQESASGRLRIPENMVPEGVVALSVSGEEVEGEDSFGINEIVFYEEYGNQIENQFDDLHWKGVHGSGSGERRSEDSLIARLVGRLKQSI